MVALAAVLLSAADARAGDPFMPDHPWHVTGYLGQHVDTRFVHVLALKDVNFTDSYIAGAAVGRVFGTSLDGGAHWEVEGSAFRHWGTQEHWEANAALLLRWQRFPWDDHVYTGAAIGHGISFATERPILERPHQRALYYLMLEVEAGPRSSRWTMVGRIHHRSGMFGLWGDEGGSNFLVLGLRHRF